MKQLKMIRPHGEVLKRSLPDGFSYIFFTECSADIDAWCDICRKANMCSNPNNEEVFAKVMRSVRGIELEKDLFFVVAPDGTKIAIASSSADPKQFTIYGLTWSESGVPTLSREIVITHGIGTNVYDIAWDLAGNIYICGNSGEYLKGFSLPRSEAFTTKAPSQYSFSVIANSIDGISVDSEDAPVEYYNLQGVKVENPSNGVFIKVQGKKSEKVYIK